MRYIPQGTTRDGQRPARGIIRSIAGWVWAHAPARQGYSREEVTSPGEEPGVDVRLQVCEGGGVDMHLGSADYDQDHSGFWGASWIPYRATRAEARAIAMDLWEQAIDAWACEQD